MVQGKNRTGLPFHTNIIVDGGFSSFVVDVFLRHQIIISPAVRASSSTLAAFGRRKKKLPEVGVRRVTSQVSHADDVITPQYSQENVNGACCPSYGQLAQQRAFNRWIEHRSGRF